MYTPFLVMACCYIVIECVLINHKPYKLLWSKSRHMAQQFQISGLFHFETFHAFNYFENPFHSNLVIAMWSPKFWVQSSCLYHHLIHLLLLVILSSKWDMESGKCTCSGLAETSNFVTKSWTHYVVSWQTCCCTLFLTP